MQEPPRATAGCLARYVRPYLRFLQVSCAVQPGSGVLSGRDEGKRIYPPASFLALVSPWVTFAPREFAPPALPHRTVRSPRGLPTRASRSRAPRHCVLQPRTCRADTDSGGLAGWPSCRNGWKGLTEFLSDTISHMRITKAPSAPHSPSVSPLGRSNSSGILSLSTAPDPLTCPPELVAS